MPLFPSFSLVVILLQEEKLEYTITCDKQKTHNNKKKKNIPFCVSARYSSFLKAEKLFCFQSTLIWRNFDQFDLETRVEVAHRIIFDF